MIGALTAAIFEPIKKPALLVPSGITAIILIAIFALTQTTIQGFLFDITLNEAVPIASAEQLPFLFYSMYANEINLILVLGFAFGILGNWLAFSFARYAKEKQGIMEAMGFATKNLSKAVYLALFNGLVIGFFAAVFWLVLVIGNINGIIGLILGIIAALVAVVCYFILSFLPVAIAAEEETIKQALKLSSGFVRKRLLATIVFFLFIGIVYNLIISIGSGLAAGIPDDLIATIIEFVFLSIAMTYAGIALPFYYLSAQE